MRYLIIFLLGGCSTIDKIRCFTIDGKAMSSCTAFQQYRRLCDKYQGLDYGNGAYGVCMDGTKFDYEGKKINE